VVGWWVWGRWGGREESGVEAKHETRGEGGEETA